MERKGHLAVFENILEENNMKLQEDGPGEIINDDAKFGFRKKKLRLCDEIRRMICKYRGCSSEFSDYYQFNEHIVNHIKEQEGHIDNHFCEFGDCDFKPTNFLHAIQHISFHGFHEMLMNLGEIVARRDSLPCCNMEYSFNCPMDVENYVCLWDNCYMVMDTFCDFLFHLKMHVNGNPRRDKNKNIKCEWRGCKKGFSVLTQLSKHMAVHTKEKYIACPTCSTTFSSLVRYSDHRNKQMPAEKQNYKCSQCSKVFPTENLLRDHVRAHINQYKCSMCDMTCPKPSNLAIHMRYRHLNERPFKCNLCDHASISRQNLEMHLITHCAEELLACDECDFKCRSIYGLDKHIQKEHGQNFGSIFECHICKKTFQRGNFLTNHLMKTHGVQWPSGHSRFRYKEDPDGIRRLQTIRYETVDVIREILKDNQEIPNPSTKKLRCHLVEEKILNQTVSISGRIEEVTESQELEKNKAKRMKTEASNVLLTISDLDDQGNIVSEFTETQALINEEEVQSSDIKVI